MERVETSISVLEVWHGKYNLEGKDNLNELPEGRAVFGVFAIVNEQPLNCRHIGIAGDLRQSVKELFEVPPEKGMKEFMQGPWIKMVVYERLSDQPNGEEDNVTREWVERYQPKVDDEGEYPGYYNS